MQAEEYECPCGRGDGCDCDGMERKANEDLEENRIENNLK